jgi:exodeoxyribonuclease VII small subunit
MAKTASKQTDSTSHSQPDFEAALARLEQIVEQLDDGNVPLAQSLALFKEGTRLAKLCRELLAQAELAVKEALRDSHGEDGDDQVPDGEDEDGA